jgi:hypothetical protein
MGPELKNVAPKIKILIYIFSKTLPKNFRVIFFPLIPSLSLQKSPHPTLTLPVLSQRRQRAVEERNGAGGVEGAEVAAVPVGLEVDVAGMGAARAAAWRQRGLQCGGSAGHGVDAAPAEWEVAEVAADSGAVRGAW